MENAPILGKSKLVPCVQELAKSCPNKIPQRYIQSHDLYNDQDHCDAHDLQLQIPIINMEALICGDGVELEKLHSTCQEWGFFQVYFFSFIGTVILNMCKVFNSIAILEKF